MGRPREVNYEKDPTELYQAIEAKEWEYALKRCENEPREAKIWVYRRDKRNADKVKWRMLPLHAAIIFKAPLSVVKAILNANPKGAKEQDDKGLLPIHIALSNDSEEEILCILLDVFPLGVTVKDKKGRMPFDHVRKCAKTNRRRWLNEERYSFEKEYKAECDIMLLNARKESAVETELLEVQQEALKSENLILKNYLQELKAKNQGYLMVHM